MNNWLDRSRGMEKFGRRYFCTEEEANEHLLKFGDSVIDELGSGEWGTAFETAKGKVVKFTTSDSELAIAKELVGHSYDHIVDIYNVSDGFIYMEKLEHREGDDYLFLEMMNMIDEIGTDFGYFNVEDYIEETGKPVSGEMIEFLKDIEGLLLDLYRLGMMHSNDTHPENLGRSIDGTLKVFDLMDRGGDRW